MGNNRGPYFTRQSIKFLQACSSLFKCRGRVYIEFAGDIIAINRAIWAFLFFFSCGISATELLVWSLWHLVFCCCCSVAQLSLVLRNPMDCSTTGFPNLHHLPELAQAHVRWVGDAIQPSYPLLSPYSPAFNLSQHQVLFQWVWLFASGGQNKSMEPLKYKLFLYFTVFFHSPNIYWATTTCKTLQDVLRKLTLHSHGAGILVGETNTNKMINVC